MNKKVIDAMAHLESILPLKSSLATLDAQARKTYQNILTTFVSEGKPPSGISTEITRLLANKDMVTTGNQSEITGAYPFTTQPRVHQVMINGHKLHAMCALDALAPSAMFNLKSSIDSQCAVTHKPVHIELDNRTVVNNKPDNIYLGINWLAAHGNQSCSESLCTEMLFLYDKDVAEQWLSVDTEQREIFSLPDAIDFSAGFFVPLLQ